MIVHQASRGLLPAPLGYPAGAKRDVRKRQSKFSFSSGWGGSSPMSKAKHPGPAFDISRVSGKMVSNLWKKPLLTSSNLRQSNILVV